MEEVGEKLRGGFSQPTVLFMVAIFLSYVFAVIHEVFLKNRSSRFKSFYFSSTGISMLCLVFGFDIWHSVLDVVIVYLLFIALGPTATMVTLTWMITMGHLIYGYADAIVSNRIHTVSWTLPQCVLVLKLIGLAFNLVDGTKNKDRLSTDQKATCIYATPSFIDYLGFCYFFGTVLAGPQMSFRRYQDFISGKLFDVSTTSGSMMAGLRRMSIGLCFAALYSLLNIYFPVKLLLSDQYSEHNFVGRLFLMIIIMDVAVHKYVLVWLLVEGACMMTGITYNGKSTNGTDDWSGISNIKLLDFELSTGMQGVISSFNVGTNHWVKCYVYKRLKWLGSRLASQFISMLFLTLWHGFWFGYILSFLTEMLFLIIEKQIVLVSQVRFGLSLSKMSWSIYFPVMGFVQLLKYVFMGYLLGPFLLLSWESCFKFLSSVYFFGHVTAAMWLIVFYSLLQPTKQKHL